MESFPSPNLDLSDLVGEYPVRKGPQTIVRLTTSYWANSRGGASFRKDITMMRRLSDKSPWMEEEITMGGVDSFFKSIINLDKCEDGLYKITTCNFSTDWETGYVDGYDLKLIPFVES
jgi:hypothetical protein